MGRVSGLHGISGWVKVYSHTQPRANILRYSPWYLGRRQRWQRARLAAGRVHGKAVIAKLEGYDTRDQVASLLDAEIAVESCQLQPLEEGEYYWAQLTGLRVVNLHGEELGIVDHLMETGANDVLVVRGVRERLIPFVEGQIVMEINLANSYIQVDWGADY